MYRAFVKFYAMLISLGSCLQPFFLLAVRLFWGWQFFKTGLGKFSDFQATAEYFNLLGIPFPEFNVYLAASTELVGGICLMIGFASRFVAIPLMITMMVALLTAHRAATLMLLDDPITFIGQLPFTFLMAAALIFVFGPGAFSVDAAN